MNLAKNYAKTYFTKIKADIKTHGKEKAMEMWREHKKELAQVHTAAFMEKIKAEFELLKKGQS